MSFENNITICAKCDRRGRGCIGACPCLVDNVDINTHAASGQCPLDRFANPPADHVPPMPPPGPNVRLTIGKTRHGVPIEERPTPTAPQAASFLKAAATGTYVAADVQDEREATCAGCEYNRYSVREDKTWCVLCGCSTGGYGNWRITELVAYVENLPEWGCHHPQRAAGRGWRR